MSRSLRPLIDGVNVHSATSASSRSRRSIASRSCALLALAACAWCVCVCVRVCVCVCVCACPRACVLSRKGQLWRLAHNGCVHVAVRAERLTLAEALPRGHGAAVLEAAPHALRGAADLGPERDARHLVLLALRTQPRRLRACTVPCMHARACGGSGSTVRHRVCGECAGRHAPCVQASTPCRPGAPRSPGPQHTASRHSCQRAPRCARASSQR
jgi:hypothetical protein